MTPYHFKDVLRYRWLPYIITLTGILLAFFAWHLLLTARTTTEHYLDSISVSFPWIALFAGIMVSLLAGLLTALFYLTYERKKSHDELRKKFELEINDRLHAEETKQKLEKALLQGQKLQAIGTLAGGIAHDFNNILYAITGYVEMAKEDVSHDTQVFNNLGNVLDAAHRGQELIARILAFSRRQHHEFTRICMRETLEGVLALLHPTIPATVHIELKTNLATECYIEGNQTQLHQVIVNIINNAVDAMDSEGKILISLEQIPASHELLSPFLEKKEGTFCKLEISDTGHGMDKATSERIFEPFFTTKEVGKGTGLGLATVHAIVEEHNGHIIVTSQLGHGTTFTVLLPEK